MLIDDYWRAKEFLISAAVIKGWAGRLRTAILGDRESKKFEEKRTFLREVVARGHGHGKRNEDGTRDLVHSEFLVAKQLLKCVIESAAASGKHSSANILEFSKRTAVKLAIPGGKGLSIQRKMVIVDLATALSKVDGIDGDFAIHAKAKPEVELKRLSLAYVAHRFLTNSGTVWRKVKRCEREIAEGKPRDKLRPTPSQDTLAAVFMDIWLGAAHNDRVYTLSDRIIESLIQSDYLYLRTSHLLESAQYALEYHTPTGSLDSVVREEEVRRLCRRVDDEPRRPR